MLQSKPTSLAPQIVEKIDKEGKFLVMDGCYRSIEERGREVRRQARSIQEALKGSGGSVEAGTTGEVRDDNNAQAARVWGQL